METWARFCSQRPVDRHYRSIERKVLNSMRNKSTGALSNDDVMAMTKAMAMAGCSDPQSHEALRVALIKFKKIWQRDQIIKRQYISDRQIRSGLKAVIQHAKALGNACTPALAKILEVDGALRDVRSETPEGAALLEDELLKEIDCVGRLHVRAKAALKGHELRMKTGATFSFEKPNAQQPHVDSLCEAIVEFWSRDLHLRATISPQSALVQFADAVLIHVAGLNLNQ